jgi:hypothetical protein
VAELAAMAAPPPPGPPPLSTQQVGSPPATPGWGTAPSQAGLGTPQRQIIVVTTQKSVGIAILLTILFGPLGMLYSTILGGFVMFFLGGAFVVLTGGIGFLVTWPICIVWGAMAADSHNKSILNVHG